MSQRANVESRPTTPLRWLLSGLSSIGQWANDQLHDRLDRVPIEALKTVRPDSEIELQGTAGPEDEKSYLMLPFQVEDGISRLEVDYEWSVRQPALPDNPIMKTVLDLGLWDEHGYRAVAGFRGWSGSRHKKVFVEATTAERGYRPGPINPGTWHVELGLAAVGPTGADWTVKIKGTRGAPGEPPKADPVDAAHIARAEPGWYHGDFHMHAWHSHPEGPVPEAFVQYARKAYLDFLPVTEYVVGHHWDQYGQIQRDNADLIIWPGREIVTYKGHVQSLGETPGFVEYRHGFEDIHIRDIQAGVRAAGALFQINHPTTFAGPLFKNFCRGCAFELDDQIDWNAVDTMEVLTGSALVNASEYHLPDVGLELPNPFMPSAIDLWEHHLNLGHRITAVCGSDDKRGPRLGTCATAVYANELSRPAIIEALRAGRAYIRTRGVSASPTLEMVGNTADGQEGTFGTTLRVDPNVTVEIAVTVGAGAGQSLRIVRNGVDLEAFEITADPFVHRFPAQRVEGEGPLGTWYRVETFDAQGRTTIGNPIFLAET